MSHAGNIENQCPVTKIRIILHELLTKENSDNYLVH
jgi:hypothetical protein